MAEGSEATGQPPAHAALDSVKVLDWTDQAGAYAGRLLADLGADVVRVEVTGDTEPWPEELLPAEGVSAFERYVNLNKRSIRVNLQTHGGQAVLADLVERADIVLTSGEEPRRWQQAGGALRGRGGAAHVHVSAYGTSGPGTALRGDDLVALAAGGLLSLGGYPDTSPVAVYGSQAYLAGGINAAIAALLGLLAADGGHGGAELDVSMQAVLAGALEDAAAEYDLTGNVRRRTGDGLREAGTGTFPCADGWIVVVAGKLGTAAAWESLVTWLCGQSVPGAEALKAPEWSSLSHRRKPEAIATFQRIMETATGDYTRAELYAELQRRRIAAAPVNNVADLLADPQLRARGFFRKVYDAVLDREVTYPGPPYRLDDGQLLDWTSAPVLGGQSDQVLADWLDADPERTAELHRDGAIA